jgi:hypothetical protein
MTNRMTALSVFAFLLGASACGPGTVDEDDCVCGRPTLEDGGTTPVTTAPMLVRVQTGKTVSASPGNGVGVFVEYAAGGQWNVSWTCDTKVTGDTCAYDINLSVARGKISKLTGILGYTLTSGNDGGFENASEDATEDATEDAPGGPVDAAPASSFDLSSSVTTNTQGVTFQTNPGTTVEISARLGGAGDGKLFFFVDDGKINDGYKGTLTDPLEFQPTSP